MTKIQVTLLKFNLIAFSHIEIELKTLGTYPPLFYRIGRGVRPADRWVQEEDLPPCADSEVAFFSPTRYSFYIENNPAAIRKAYQRYYKDTDGNSTIFHDNCADCAQWFLEKYAKIPAPNLSNFSWDHLTLFLFWPSFIPCPVTIPGRVMSNAEFYMEARRNHRQVYKEAYLSFCMKIALALLVLAASQFALLWAIKALEGALAVVTIVTASCAFFKAYNTLSAEFIEEPKDFEMESVV